MRMYGMEKLVFTSWFYLTVLILSCAASPEVMENPPPPGIISEDLTLLMAPESPLLEHSDIVEFHSPASVPEMPVKPRVPELIMGKGLTEAQELAALLLQ